MTTPTKEQCYELFKKYNTPANVIKHSEAVNKVAVFLAKKLKQAGVSINIELVDRASLLHDLKRLDNNHAEAAARVLEKEGYAEVAGIVKLHRYKDIEVLDSWEEKVVNYADKVTLYEPISVVERAAGWAEKYPNNKDEILARVPIMKKFEKEIFNKLGLKPKQLKELVK